MLLTSDSIIGGIITSAFGIILVLIRTTPTMGTPLVIGIRLVVGILPAIRILPAIGHYHRHWPIIPIALALRTHGYVFTSILPWWMQLFTRLTDLTPLNRSFRVPALAATSSTQTKTPYGLPFHTSSSCPPQLQRQIATLALVHTAQL